MHHERQQDCSCNARIKMAKSPSKRTSKWRESQSSKGFKPVTVYLHEQTIELLERLQKHNGGTRATIITKAVTQLEHYSDDTETGDGVHVTILEGQLSFLQEQLKEKDQQIRDLINSQLQTNHLLGGFQKTLGLLEHKQDDTGTSPVDLPSVDSDSVKSFKKKKKSKKKKK